VVVAVRRRSKEGREGGRVETPMVAGREGGREDGLGGSRKEQRRIQ
jgi:hypothetical protein